VGRRRIKPIETRYSGYRFRSRLEARWAVFFDALGLEYSYEPEGYDLGAGVGAYRPDFYLPAQSGFRGGYGEIKPREPLALERRRCEALAEGLRQDVYVFYGPLSIPSYETPYVNPGIIFLGTGGWDDDHYWCACHLCGAVGIEFLGWEARLACRCDHSRCPERRCTEMAAPDLRDAFLAAREARFERAS